MFTSMLRNLGNLVLALCLVLLSTGKAQDSSLITPPITIPPPLAAAPTPEQQQALQNMTAAQDQLIRNIFVPQMQQIIQGHTAATGTFRTWQDLIANGTTQSTGQPSYGGPTGNSSLQTFPIQFSDVSGNPLMVNAVFREYHPAIPTTGGGDPGGGTDPSDPRDPTDPTQPVLPLQPISNTMQQNFMRVPPIGPAYPVTDQDGDGLSDVNADVGDFEGQLAANFVPITEYRPVSNSNSQHLATTFP